MTRFHVKVCGLHLRSWGYWRTWQTLWGLSWEHESQVRVDGELLEEIEVENWLRQGCTMAPSLFNLYACVVAERWLERVSTVEGVGTYLLYKYDQKLFRRNTRGPSSSTLYECEFADNMGSTSYHPCGSQRSNQSIYLWQIALAWQWTSRRPNLWVVGSGIEDEDL